MISIFKVYGMKTNESHNIVHELCWSFGSDELGYYIVMNGIHFIYNWLSALYVYLYSVH